MNKTAQAVAARATIQVMPNTPVHRGEDWT
jgi:hypothetical protein